MSNKILVYCVSGWEGDANWISNSKVVNNIEKAEIVVFPGGADINPKLYGFSLDPRTHYSDVADKRDLDAWNKLKPNQLAVGICRGAQFLCAINGGKLIQDVDGHAIGRTHSIYTVSNPTIELQALSLHHQMMYPFNLTSSDYTMLYIAHNANHFNNISTDEKSGLKLNIDKIYEQGEPEVVVFHKEGKPISLAIQSHPEMMRSECGFVREMNNIIVELLKKD